MLTTEARPASTGGDRAFSKRRAAADRCARSLPSPMCGVASGRLSGAAASASPQTAQRHSSARGRCPTPSPRLDVGAGRQQLQRLLIVLQRAVPALGLRGQVAQQLVRVCAAPAGRVSPPAAGACLHGAHSSMFLGRSPSSWCVSARRLRPRVSRQMGIHRRPSALRQAPVPGRL